MNNELKGNIGLNFTLFRQVNGEWKIWMPGFGWYEKTGDSAGNTAKIEEKIERFFGSVKFTMELLPAESGNTQNSQNVQLAVHKLAFNMGVKVYINGIDLLEKVMEGDFSGLTLVNKEYNETPFPQEQKILNVGKNTLKIEYHATGLGPSLKFDLGARGYSQPILKIDVNKKQSGVVEQEFDIQPKEPAGFKTIVITE